MRESKAELIVEVILQLVAAEWDSNHGGGPRSIEAAQRNRKRLVELLTSIGDDEK